MTNLILTPIVLGGIAIPPAFSYYYCYNNTYANFLFFGGMFASIVIPFVYAGQKLKGGYNRGVGLAPFAEPIKGFVGMMVISSALSIICRDSEYFPLFVGLATGPFSLACYGSSIWITFSSFRK